MKKVIGRQKVCPVTIQVLPPIYKHSVWALSHMDTWDQSFRDLSLWSAKLHYNNCYRKSLEKKMSRRIRTFNLEWTTITKLNQPNAGMGTQSLCLLTACFLFFSHSLSPLVLRALENVFRGVMFWNALALSFEIPEQVVCLLQGWQTLSHIGPIPKSWSICLWMAGSSKQGETGGTGGTYKLHTKGQQKSQILYSSKEPSSFGSEVLFILHEDPVLLLSLTLPPHLPSPAAKSLSSFPSFPVSLTNSSHLRFDTHFSADNLSPLQFFSSWPCWRAGQLWDCLKPVDHLPGRNPTLQPGSSPGVRLAGVKLWVDTRKLFYSQAQSSPSPQ